MLQQIKLAAFVVLVCLVFVLLLAVMGDYASGSDYVVSRGTTIESERPIGLLIVEAGLGVLNGRQGAVNFRDRNESFGDFGGVESRLSVDGVAQSGRTSFLAAWRLVGFLLWDADGRIERTTTATVRGHAVRISDVVENGNVQIVVRVGPPLGDPRVRCAVLTLEADEHARRSELPIIGTRFGQRTTIRVGCSAVIDLPGDRCRVVRRVSERAAREKAGPEIRDRVAGLAAGGQSVVDAGRGRLVDSVVAEFLEGVCR